MSTITRQDEIQQIWKDYQSLYILLGILIGMLIFPLLELIVGDLNQLLIGLIPEVVGISFTVFLLDRIYQRREIENLKKRLIGETRSYSNETAKSAVDWMRHEGWITGEDGLLKHTDLQKVHLREANLRYANLEEANLRYADLHRADLWEANLQGVDLWGVNLREAELNGANFRGANLREAHLEDADLVRVCLAKVNLFGAHLEGVDLTESDLEDAVLFGSYLREADLDEARCQKAVFTKAHLEGANLRGTDLQEALFAEAHLEGADLTNANLQNAIWEKESFGRTYTAILPDGTKWTSKVNMACFTDENHPEYSKTREKIKAIREEVDLTDYRVYWTL
jgi:uncharacterized protein YjbI with pentapeptide repeats